MKRLVIANRGEIARRILRAARQFGWKVAVVSTPEDSDSPVRFEADEVLEVDSFLNAAAIVQAARRWRAQLLHPGYGFLSENSDFAQLVEEAGIAFVGPTPLNMRAMGGKESAKGFAKRCQVPTLEALLNQELKDVAENDWPKLLAERGITAPYLVKASGGGGGRGMRIVEHFADLPEAIRRASNEARSSFNDPTVFVERYLVAPRHVEIQVFGDGQGGGVFWGERECSLQRRHQKVLEEAPSPVVDQALRERMGRAALALVRETKYRGAGTVEFLLTNEGEFFFLEMNTRLQVEHPVTELVYNIDLVKAQFELALGHWPSGFPSPDQFQVPTPCGVAIEARLLAEDPRAGFLPTPGPLTVYRECDGSGVRVDSGVVEGGRVNDKFDSMIAKVIAHAPTRAAACDTLARALEDTVVHGCTTNLPFLIRVAMHQDYVEGRVSTAWIGTHTEELTRSLLPEELVQFFLRFDVRQALAFALRDRTAGVVRTRTAYGGTSDVGGRFAALLASQPSSGVSGLNVGSKSELKALEVRVGVEDHRFHLSGAGLTEVLRTLDSDACEDLTFSLQTAIFRAQTLPDRPSEVSCRLSRPRGDSMQLTVFGETLTLPWPDDSRAQLDLVKSGQAATGVLKAPMAGQVLEVRVADGDTVHEGDVLFVLESMKMQLEIRAPRDGTVSDIRVVAGMTLAGPDVLAEIKDL